MNDEYSYSGYTVCSGGGWLVSMPDVSMKCVWQHDKMLGGVSDRRTIVKKTKGDGWVQAVLVITDKIGISMNYYSKKH